MHWFDIVESIWSRYSFSAKGPEGWYARGTTRTHPSSRDDIVWHHRMLW
jgi:hypothetical protein